jgi:hypothetical protein
MHQVNVFERRFVEVPPFISDSLGGLRQAFLFLGAEVDVAILS